MDMSNKIDLAELITKYGTECFQDFEGFSSSEEQELLVNEIKKCSKIFEYKGAEFIQNLCDIVLIKLVGELNEGEFDITYYLTDLLEYMVFWDDVLSCRYLLKSGMNWNEKEGE